MAWFALIPLFLLISSHRAQAFRLGITMGLVANLIIFFWVWKTFLAAGIAIWTILLSWGLLALVLSLYFGVFSITYALIPGKTLKPILVSATWVVLESIRGFILTGFPWALFSHTQASHPILIQVASLTGAPFLSFLLVFSNCTFTRIIPINLRTKNVFREKMRDINLWIFISLLLLTVFWGKTQLKTAPHENSPKINVAILQGNIDQYQKWNDQYERDIRTTYEALVKEATLQNPDLILWPESAVPGWYPNDPRYRKWIQDLVQPTQTHHIVGAVRAMRNKDLNSAFLINTDGLPIQIYDKLHLVPFGEYIPFGNALKKIIPYLGQMGIFDPGDKPVLFSFGDVTATPNICYEAIFSSLIRKGVRMGANLIINITNDGWFLDTAAPEQHLVANIFRAVENGRPVLRAANTGISAIIDAQGRVIHQKPIMTRGILFGSVRLPLAEYQTVYGRWGEWFSILCWIIVLFSILRHYVPRIKRPTR
jgi:apolipoprotein N-acyltransferase